MGKRSAKGAAPAPAEGQRAAEEEVVTPPPSAGFVMDIFNSIFTPGINNSVVLLFNLACGSLLVALIALGFMWEFNVHILLLIFSHTGLMIAMQWFIRQMPADWRHGVVKPDGSASETKKTD